MENGKVGASTVINPCRRLFEGELGGGGGWSEGVGGRCIPLSSSVGRVPLRGNLTTFLTVVARLNWCSKCALKLSQSRRDGVGGRQGNGRVGGRQGKWGPGLSTDPRKGPPATPPSSNKARKKRNKINAGGEEAGVGRRRRPGWGGGGGRCGEEAGGRGGEEPGGGWGGGGVGHYNYEPSRCLTGGRPH